MNAMTTKSERTGSLSLQVHRYIPPPDHPLHPYLQSIWRARDKGTVRRETILPKGNLDIVFCLSEPHKVIPGVGAPETPFRLFPCFIYGVQTRALQVLPRGYYSLIGVSLKMEACAALLPFPASELTNLPVEAKLIFKNTFIL